MFKCLLKKIDYIPKSHLIASGITSAVGITLLAVIAIIDITHDESSSAALKNSELVGYVLGSIMMLALPIRARCSSCPPADRNEVMALSTNP